MLENVNGNKNQAHPASDHGTLSAKEDKRKERFVSYFVDGETLMTADSTLTVEQVLRQAGLDPATHYLIELRGQHQLPHQTLTEVLHIHNQERFVSIFNGPTPVS